ncbi:MAG: VWA domain-containing protein [Planctomycetes bacterium]|nr:VWA domain-containing protein [Planctomycetota bacterium]
MSLRASRRVFWRLACAVFLSAASAVEGQLELGEDGAPVKLIALRQSEAVEFLDVPGKPAPDRLKVLAGDIFFKLAADARRHPEHHAVALNGEDGLWGLVPKKDFLEWPTRLAVRLLERSGGSLVSIHGSAKIAAAALESQGLELETAVARESPLFQAGSVLPVLGPPVEATVRGERMTFFRVAALSSGSSVPRPRQAPPSKEQSGFTLDVVVVLDQTSSMESVIDRVKGWVRALGNDLEGSPRLKPFRDRIRFGLVTYTDRLVRYPFEEALDFMARQQRVGSPVTIACKLGEASSAEEFLRRLDSVGTVAADTEEFAENVLGGLAVAATDAMGWNKAVASRHLVLVGDASGHDEERSDALAGALKATGRLRAKNPDMLSSSRVLERCQPRDAASPRDWGITVHAVHIAHAPGRDPRSMAAEHAVAREQFARLARGKSRQGHFTSCAAPAADPGAFSPALADAIEEDAERLWNDCAVKPAPSPVVRGSRDARRLHGLSITAVDPVGDGPPARAGELIVGYVGARMPAGDGSLEVVIGCSQRDLDSMMGWLAAVIGFLKTWEPGEGDSVFRNVKVMTDKVGGGQRLKPSDTLRSMLLRRFPVSMRASCMDRTFSELERLDAAGRDRLVLELNEVLSKIEALRTRDGFWVPVNAPSRGNEEQCLFGFLRLTDLP